MSDAIVKNLSNSSQINWEDVLITKEFQACLQFEDLKELSLVSKLLRSKLKPKLFSNIVLNGKLFDPCFINGKNLIYEYFEFFRYIMSWNSIEEYEDSHCKELEVEPAYKEFEDQILGFKHLVKSFNLTELGSAGYYLLPLANSFSNLNTLKILNCTVSLSGFNDLLSSKDKLTSIELTYTNFTKLPTEKLKLEDVKFPKTLTNLYVYECHLGENELITNPYDFLFDKVYSGTTNDFILPSTSIPSLKNLSFLAPYYNDSGLNEFLGANNQLEFLHFKSSSLDQVKIDHFQKSKTLKKLEIVCESEMFNEVNIPTLSSIEEIEIQYLRPKVFTTIKDLCLSSPNLKKLNIIFDTYDDFANMVNRLLSDVIANSHNLKELTLWIFGDFEGAIDLKKLNNIEVLNIHANLVTLLNIEFNKSNSLKRVNLGYNETDTDLDAIKEKFNMIQDWKFEISEGSIEGVNLKYITK
ncbi:hypothetical protein CONCODRAFT_120917 [Conidiobolus coronatus NRRL 28638]|uniref:RNI-like protein n=1 Tax=Conidiobolus coronatus (strain ATCC 28846 / CBS 209.66 / NRRL 28638) TaxID=796925 RepID=A0A137NWR2_CONC2|nr:hypothetical protein CONCODRAFT_120917 [Conidiobolus coronatus NRRL 28638]|eukprot:KXN67128.1 hypothetical protein CONCODRAFT_120917 [Conidiobolus coronatus NRRL 28638]